jgi:hypothetical protein
MAADLSTFPLQELKDDLRASTNDIIVCELALMQGHKTYGDGKSTQRRLDVNKQIVKMIEAELKRRENTKQEAECHTSQS